MIYHRHRYFRGRCLGDIMEMLKRFFPAPAILTGYIQPEILIKSPGNMKNIFTYGSLMFDQVWPLVVNGNYLKTEAILNGYDRKRIKGEVYPAVYPSSIHSQVNGIVYFDVSSTDIVKLDIFEGEYYYRKTENVVISEKNRVAAEVYVLKEEYYPALSHQNWDAEQFRQKDIQNFLNCYVDSYRKNLEGL